MYLAFDERLARNVALKTVVFSADEPDDAGSHGAMLERFEREAKTLALLHHSNIVPVYDFGCADDIPYLVMNYFDGEPVTRWGRKENPSVNQWLHVASLLLGALVYAHEHGVLHRDIKPTNVLLRGTAALPELNLIDWGIALPSMTPRVTAAGQFVGTFGWVDPAIIANAQQSWTVQSDLYSVGVLLYLILCQKMPIDVPEELSLGEKMERYIHGKPVPPQRHRADLPAEVCDFLLRLLQNQPADRLASAAEAKAILDQLIEGDGSALERAPTLAAPNVNALTKPTNPAAAAVAAPNAAVQTAEPVYDLTHRKPRWKSVMKRHLTAVAVSAAAFLALIAVSAASVLHKPRSPQSAIEETLAPESTPPTMEFTSGETFPAAPAAAAAAVRIRATRIARHEPVKRGPAPAAQLELNAPTIKTAGVKAHTTKAPAGAAPVPVIAAKSAEAKPAAAKPAEEEDHISRGFRASSNEAVHRP